MTLRSVPTFSWRTVDAGGARVQYVEAGAGDPLVFLHGWGLTPRVYLPAVGQLTRAGLRVVAPVLPGFGGSEPLRLREVSIAGYAARVAAFLDALPLGKPAFVMGHSLGGGIAIDLATARPDLVRSLTLIDSVGGSPGRPAFPGSTRIPGMTHRPWWRWALAVAAEVDPRTVLALGPRRTAGVVATLLRDLVPNLTRRPITSAVSALVALGADLAEPAQALVDSGLPVLFVWGDQDRLIAPGAFAAVANHMPPEIVQGRHGWLLTAPDDFAHLLQNALVVHAMLERARRGEDVDVPEGVRLADQFPRERRRRARRER